MVYHLKTTNVTTLLTPAQAAQALGLAVKTLYNWKSNGTLTVPVVTLPGGCWRINQDDLDDYIASHTAIQEPAYKRNPEVSRALKQTKEGNKKTKPQRKVDDWTQRIKVRKALS